MARFIITTKGQLNIISDNSEQVQKYQNMNQLKNYIKYDTYYRSYIDVFELELNQQFYLNLVSTGSQIQVSHFTNISHCIDSGIMDDVRFEIYHYLHKVINPSGDVFTREQAKSILDSTCVIQNENKSFEEFISDIYLQYKELFANDEASICIETTNNIYLTYDEVNKKIIDKTEVELKFIINNKK